VIPRTAIGAGIGAGVGALTGAATYKAPPGQQATLSGRLGRAAVGGVAGGVAGGGIHGALRYRKMAPNLMATGRVAEAVKGQSQGVQQAAGRLQHSFLGQHSVGDTVSHLQKSNPYQGLDNAAAKKLHRTNARTWHPDRNKASDAQEQFIKNQNLYNHHKSVFDPKSAKQASLALDSAQWNAFFSEITKIANLSKSPAVANSIKASVKGTKPKALAGLGNPGIMPTGQSGITATISPMPQRALT
jgi:hypothetical protein